MIFHIFICISPKSERSCERQTCGVLWGDHDAQQFRFGLRQLKEIQRIVLGEYPFERRTIASAESIETLEISFVKCYQWTSDRNMQGTNLLPVFLGEDFSDQDFFSLKFCHFKIQF